MNGQSFMQMESCSEENGKIALQQLKRKVKGAYKTHLYNVIAAINPNISNGIL